MLILPKVNYFLINHDFRIKIMKIKGNEKPHR